MLKISVPDLKESNLFLNELYQNVTSAIFIADDDARIHHFNDSFRTLFYKPEDQILKYLCGNAMGCIFAVDEMTECGSTSNCGNCLLRENIVRSFTEKVPVYKARMTRKFYIGDRLIEKHFVFTTKYIKYSEQEMVLVIIDDITHEVEKQRKLKERNNVLMTILQNRVREFAELQARISCEAAEKDALRKELQHRMGNSLQLITSLLSLHSRDTEDGNNNYDFMKIIESVQIIKLMYSNLIDESGTLLKVNIQSYIKSIISSLQSPHGTLFGFIQFDTDIDYYQLSIDIALPLGMIMYELLSNAIELRKPDKEGRVEISLKKTDEHYCRLHVQDDGATLSVRQFEESGLGLELVYILCEQIKGECITKSADHTQGKNSIQVVFLC